MDDEIRRPIKLTRVAFPKVPGEGVGQTAIVQESLRVIPPGHAFFLGIIDQNLVKGGAKGIQKRTGPGRQCRVLFKGPAVTFHETAMP